MLCQRLLTTLGPVYWNWENNLNLHPAPFWEMLKGYDFSYAVFEFLWEWPSEATSALQGLCRMGHACIVPFLDSCRPNSSAKPQTGFTHKDKGVVFACSPAKNSQWWVQQITDEIKLAQLTVNSFHQQWPIWCLMPYYVIMELRPPSDLIPDRKKRPPRWNALRLNNKSNMDSKIMRSQIFERIFHCNKMTIAYID